MKKNSDGSKFGLIFLENLSLVSEEQLQSAEFIIATADLITAVKRKKNRRLCTSKTKYYALESFEPGPDFANRFATFFDSFCERNSLAQLRGFCNAIYESSCITLMQYYLALLEVRERHPECRVAFSDAILSGYGSTYLMAEWERSVTRLYDRRRWFGSYIHAYAAKQGISLIAFEPSFFDILHVRYYLNFAYRKLLQITRCELVFLAKLMLSVKRGLTSPFAGRKPKLLSDTEVAVDVMFISRTPVQTNFLSPLINGHEVSTALLGFESFSFYGSNQRAFASLTNGNAIYAWSITEINYQLTCLANLWKRWVLKEKAEFVYHDFFIDVTDAIREALAIEADLSAYIQSLEKKLATCKSYPRWIISGEHKSQAAYAEAEFAKRHRISYAQFIECDHLARKLPRIEPGKVVFVNSLFSEKEFVSKLNDNRFKFIGNPRNLNPTEPRNTENRSNINKIIFFTKPNEISNSKRVISAISKCLEADEELIVKLHPRDGAVYLNVATNKVCKIVRHGEKDLVELLSDCRLAVTYNSTVAMTLLELSIPYVVLRFTEGEDYELPYATPQSENVARTVPALEHLLKEREKLVEISKNRRLEVLGTLKQDGNELTRRLWQELEIHE